MIIFSTILLNAATFDRSIVKFAYVREDVLKVEGVVSANTTYKISDIIKN